MPPPLNGAVLLITWQSMTLTKCGLLRGPGVGYVTWTPPPHMPALLDTNQHRSNSTLWFISLFPPGNMYTAPPKERAVLFVNIQSVMVTLILTRDSYANSASAPPLPVKTLLANAWLLVRNAESASALLLLKTESDTCMYGESNCSGRLLNPKETPPVLPLKLTVEMPEPRLCSNVTPFSCEWWQLNISSTASLKYLRKRELQHIWRQFLSA